VKHNELLSLLVTKLVEESKKRKNRLSAVMMISPIFGDPAIEDHAQNHDYDNACQD